MYGKAEALRDLENPFEVYENDALRFLHLTDGTVVVNYRNIRKRKGMEEVAFRVTAVWHRRSSGWSLVSQHSSRIS